jgi:hypothetical protein
MRELRPTCLLTFQRSGSEVVIRYLAAAGLDNAGEMLCTYHGNPYALKRTFGAAADAPYHQQWHRSPVVLQPDRTWQYHFFNAELKERIKTLVEHHRPVVVKAFTSSALLTTRSLNVEQLFESFDVVVLRRRNAWKVALSTEICNAIQTWHIDSAEHLESTREKLRQLRLTITEPALMHSIEALNRLKVIHDNIAAFGPQHRAICYEDVVDSPRERLNALLGYDVAHCDLPVKFIEDHEAHVENIERLRTLYDRYALKD